VSDPYGLRGAGFSEGVAFSVGLRLLRAEWPRVLAIAALFSVPATWASLTFGPQGDGLEDSIRGLQVTTVYESLLGLVGGQAILALFIARLEGRRLGLRQALGEGFGNWGRAFAAHLRSTFVIGLFSLLLVVPGVWKTTQYMFTSVAVLRAPREDALAASEGAVEGRAWRLFGFGLLALSMTWGLTLLWAALLGLVSSLLSTPVPDVAQEYVNDLGARLLSDGVLTAALLVAFVTRRQELGDSLPAMVWRTPPSRG
jgi:hypothetical protein